jgi:glycosyltransferase involved in cell wall biosynthesis
MAALRVGLDGRAFHAPAAGVRRYVGELTRALARCPGDVEIVALGPSRPECVPGGIEIVPAPSGDYGNALWQIAVIPRLARRARVDVLHAPAYTAPIAGAPPVVLTIHDVSYARRPDFYPYRRDALRRLFYRLSALRADAIITVSGFSAGEIAAAYGVPRGRVRVIHEAAAAGFLPAPASPPRPGWSPPHVLHVGDLHERRDLFTALRAVVRVRQSVSRLSGLRLVVIGVDREGVGARLDAMAREVGQADAVVRLESVSERELVEWYQHAAALVYPSRYEGFGLPLVEAMACGTPVIAADAAASTEVLGGAGVLCPPGDEGAFSDALTSVLCHPEIAERHRQLGLERAAAFSWDRAARETLEVYRQCDNRRTSR